MGRRLRAVAAKAGKGLTAMVDLTHISEETIDQSGADYLSDLPPRIAAAFRARGYSRAQIAAYHEKRARAARAGKIPPPPPSPIHVPDERHGWLPTAPVWTPSPPSEYVASASASLHQMLAARGVIPIRKIQAECARYFKVSVVEIISLRRSAFLVRARQVAMFICKELTHFTYPEIGRVFRRDHSTVVHGVSVIAEMIANGDMEIINAVRAIRAELTGETDES